MKKLEREKIYKYNLTVPEGVWIKIVEIAVENSTEILRVVRFALKLFIKIYNANKEGKSIKIDDKEIQIIF